MFEAIPNQPITFGVNINAGCLCPSPEDRVMFDPTDIVTFQVRFTDCPEEQLLGSPDFEDRNDWKGGGWNLQTGLAGTEVNTRIYPLQDLTFTPTIGNVYQLELYTGNFYNTTATLSFGGESFGPLTGGNLYKFVVVATTEDPYTITLSGISAVIYRAAVYGYDPDYTVSLIDSNGSVFDSFTYASNPENFEFPGQDHMNVSYPLTDAAPSEGCYTIRIEDGCDETQLDSDEIVVRDAGCGLLLTSCLGSSALGFRAPFTTRMRVPAKLCRPSWSYDVREQRMTNGVFRRPYAERFQTQELRIGEVGMVNHLYISSLPLWDHFYIEQEEYVITADDYTPSYADVWDDHGGIVLRVTPKVDASRKVQCEEEAEGCAPPPNYHVQGTGPNEDYIVQTDGFRILINE